MGCVGFSKILEISFSTLDCFRAFFRACLCKRMQIDLFGFPSSKFRSQKILGNRIPKRNFRAADGSLKMLADLILHSK